jgi:PPK2 family polyphosphate:nucleotide phosphotransferase
VRAGYTPPMSKRILDPVPSPYLVPFDGSFRVSGAATEPPVAEQGSKKRHKRALERTIERLKEGQRVLAASDQRALLLVFQAMDAAGKDGTIRAVMSGVNPAGCQVYSFKQPSKEELDHDFLWRVNRCLPERGRIGIFNRSHYEEVLVVRVHPGYLAGQRIPGEDQPEALFHERYESIRSMERHLARNGTMILKFWLNVSQEAQCERLVARIDEPESNWKFNEGDLKERALWDDYMSAYEAALNETSRPWAPWYAIPADSKSFMRRTVAEIVAAAIGSMDLRYPSLSDEEQARLKSMRAALVDKS